MKVISIGDLVTDFYYKNGKLVGVSGGMSSHNIIANLSKFKVKTAVYGVCGDDDAGKVALNSLKKLGVDVENVFVSSGIQTRCFHVSYYEKSGKLEFTSKKRCPYCNNKKWYLESAIDPAFILKHIDEEDILVFDNLNSKNQIVIDESKNRKMLDLGQYFELEEYSDDEILSKIGSKFELINLNDRVLKYLLERFHFNNLNELNHVLQAKLLIVTQGKKGAIFSFDNQILYKKLETITEEVDATGAGDAFFSVFIRDYIKNNFVIDHDFIDQAFASATKLTQKVVKKFGARSHLQSLFKIKKIDQNCTCDKFLVMERKQIKRCNINVNHLEARVLNAIHSKAYESLQNIDFLNSINSLYVGTGGSFAAAVFASKVINQIYATNTLAMYPRDVYYRNNDAVDHVFLFSYSGTTSDLIESTNLIHKEKKFIITKGDVKKITLKTQIPKKNILSYCTSNNKSSERGFLSFEGVVSPSALFLKYYFDYYHKDNLEEFLHECFFYWHGYFDDYFKNNKISLKEFLKIGNTINVFWGDFTTVAGLDLESKITESGIFNVILHEKKNFSHGRFINYEYRCNHSNIYLKQNKTTEYELKLLSYLKDGNNLILESRYDGILCEFDLLVASQYLIYYISNYLSIDLSKPTYSEDAMKIYFYKGIL